LQEYRQRRQGELRPVVLNQIVHAVTAAWNAGTTEHAPAAAAHAPALFTLALADKLPPVLGLRGPLRRVLFFLLKNASDAQAGNHAPILIRTRAAAGHVELIVEDSGPPLDPQQLSHVFDLVSVRPGCNSLELAACKSIVRRLDGNIRAGNRTQGGVAVVVELPAAHGIG
jgi:C4-dicarboxylate-specific signal transduction histidine kinase